MPPPGGWPPPQQPGPPPYGESHPQPQFGSQPPSGWQQGDWPQQPTPTPQKQSSSLKWLLIGVAVLLVVAISVGATLLITRDDRGGASTPTSGASSDTASANDTGPVAIITEEPTCQTFIGINNSLASIEANGWTDRRNTLGPAQNWTDEERAQVQTVASAISNATDQMGSLARQTPHRVTRELYQQTIIYGKLYADSISTYEPRDNYLADVFVNGSSAIAGMCTAASNGAAGRSIGIPPAPAPSSNPNGNLSAAPKRFISDPSTYCADWVEREKRFVADTTPWAALDASIPSSEWSPEQRQTQLAAVPIFDKYADDIAAAAPQSNNPTLEDFALGSALYLRAYVAAMDNYTDADSWLYYTAFRLSNTVTGACQAVG